MKIISYNVNGVRAALKKGLAEWIVQEDPDIICLQEIKVDDENAPKAVFTKMGYHQVWHSAEKKGYSGVATFSKIKPSKYVIGMGQERFDREGRVLRTDINGISVYNCYFPSGSSGEERHNFKLDFLKEIGPWMNKELKQSKNIVVLGDYNIVHTELDIHNPKRKDNPSGYRPEERAWLDDWFQTSFHDAYRSLFPEKIAFSWWSYRAGARGNNKGWRIDYISVTKKILKALKSATHLSEAKHSDHCPISVEVDMNKLST